MRVWVCVDFQLGIDGVELEWHRGERKKEFTRNIQIGWEIKEKIKKNAWENEWENERKIIRIWIGMREVRRKWMKENK